MLLGLIFFALSSCQLDDAPHLLEEIKEKRLIVTADDIPGVISSLSQVMGMRPDDDAFTVNHNEVENDLTIDWDRIMQLVDTLGNETYAFGIADRDGDPFTFYNLILKFDDTGSVQRPFLLKYQMDEDFIPEYLATLSMENFKGNVSKIFLDKRSLPGLYSANSEFNEEVDACPGTTVYTTSTTGGGGGGGPSGDEIPDLPPPGSTDGCITYLVRTDWYQCNNSACDNPVFLRTEYSLRIECDPLASQNTANLEDDCQPTDDEIPINPPNDPFLPPCAGDPLNSPVIAKTKRGVNGGRYGMTRQDQKGNPREHDGLDLASPIGMPLYSMFSGTVIGIRDTFSEGEYLKGSYGNFIIIQSQNALGETFYIKYNHLNAVNVTAGQEINARTIIGKTGTTGNAEDFALGIIPHVHIQARVKVNNVWTKANPEDFMTTKFSPEGVAWPQPCVN